MDFKLRLILHIPPLLPFSILYSPRNGLSGNPFVATCIYNLAREGYAERELIMQRFLMQGDSLFPSTSVHR